jgi:blue copper oxidase
MKLNRLLSSLVMVCIALTSHAQYNNMSVPDTLSGTTFNLRISDTFRQMISGNQTVCAGINNNWWGPTLILKQGDVVQMNVYNNLQDTTTIHWHGMHLPAIMDGGPHQTTLYFLEPLLEGYQ